MALPLVNQKDTWGIDFTPGFSIGALGQGFGDLLAGGSTKRVSDKEWNSYVNPAANTPYAPKKVGNTNTGQTGTSTTTNTGGAYYTTGGSTGYQPPAYDPAVISQYDQGIDTIQDALNRLSTQLNIARGNINKSFSTQTNELNSAKSANQNTYNTSTTQNQQNYRTNKNAITDQASSGLRGLLRMLGAYGAVGSDLGLASGAVNDVATQQRAGSGQTFAQNQQGLDTNWNNYLSEWGNSKRKLDDWRDQQLDSAEQQSLSNRQDLLTRLADLRGSRAAAMGGNYAGGAEADLAAARGLSGRIDALGKLNPTYTGKTPVYQQRALDSYAAPQAAQANIAGTGNTSANPFLSLLLPEDERRTV